MRKCSLVDFFTPLGHLMSLVTGQLGSPVPSAVSTALVFQCRVLKPLVFQSLPYRVQSTGLPVQIAKGSGLPVLPVQRGLQVIQCFLEQLNT